MARSEPRHSPDFRMLRNADRPNQRGSKASEEGLQHVVLAFGPLGCQPSWGTTATPLVLVFLICSFIEAKQP